MGRRVLEFARLHPDTSPAFVAAVARLQERLARAHQPAQQQLDGRSAVHVAARKAELRRLIRRTHLHHLAVVASVEEPELARKFAIPLGTTTYNGFQAAASGMSPRPGAGTSFSSSTGWRRVLSGLEVAFDQFDSAVEQGAQGRLTHIGARSELDRMAEEVVQIVKVMTGLIRVRFAGQELLDQWESASNVVAAPRSEEEKPESGTTPPTGTSPAGEVRAAA